MRRLRVRPPEQLLLQNYKTQRHAAFLKIPYLSRMINCKIDTDLSVRLFPRTTKTEVLPTQSLKISTLYHNFLIHCCRDFCCRDFFHILHICTITSRFPCVSIRPGSFLIICYEFLKLFFNALKFMNSCTTSLIT